MMTTINRDFYFENQGMSVTVYEIVKENCEKYFQLDNFIILFFRCRLSKKIIFCKYF